MKNVACVCIVLAAGALVGCASHGKLVSPRLSWEAAGVADGDQGRAIAAAMTDEDISRLLDVKVQARLPTSLAVAKLQDECGGYQPRLARLDGEELEGWEKVAAAAGAIDGVQPVSNLSFGNGLGEPNISLHSLRTAAARTGCELLLVYMQGDSAVDNYNDAAVLYWTFVGLWLVPGHTLEHQTICQAVLVDCRTGLILGTATGSAHQKRLATAVALSIQEAKLEREVPAEAISELQDGVRDLLGQIARRASEPARKPPAEP